VVDQILRPAFADSRQIDADIGVEVHIRVRRVEVDDGNAGGAGFFTTSTRLPRLGLW